MMMRIYVIKFIRRMLPSTLLSSRCLRCPARVNVAVLQVEKMVMMLIMLLMMMMPS